jgi:hypothetical protein
MPLRDDLRQPAAAGAAAMAVAAAFLVYAGVAVVRAGALPGAGESGAGAGLSYRALAAELGEALREAPAESLLRVDSATVVLAGRPERVDSLVIIADTTRFPSLREGGFLRDQVALYNGFQRWRSEVGGLRAEWFDSLAALNPSVFRIDYRPRDGPAVARVPTVYSLRLPSPFEDAWRVRVVSREQWTSPGLISRSARVLLRQNVAVPIEIDGRRHECRIERRNSTVRFYCKSLLQTPQLTMRLDSTLPPRGVARAGWASFQYDGAAVQRGDSTAVVTGGLLTIKGLEPSVFTQYQPGLISAMQWINGRARRVRSGPAVLQFLGQLGSRPPADGARGEELTVRLSVDGALSTELSDALTAYTTGIPVDFASVMLANAATGEIVGIGEAGARSNPDRTNLMRPVNVGSAIKPVLAAAILSERPELAGLEMGAVDGPVESVFGLPTGGFHSALLCGMPAGGWIDLSYFIRCSNNQYAAALVLAGLSETTPEGRTVLAEGVSAPFRLRGATYTDRRPRIPLDRAGRVPRDWAVSTPLASGLLRLFDVAADPTVSDEVSRTSAVWRDLRYSNGTAVRVPWELLPEESRPALVGRKASGTSPALLAAYGYGGWENQWTLLDLTQAFGRILTDRKLSLTFVPAASTTPPQAPGLGIARLSWYRTLTGALGEVGETGTAAGLNDRWRAIPGEKGVVFAKTGTLAEADDSLFVRTVVFGLGRDEAATGAALDCGLLGVVYFKFRQRPVANSPLVAYHTDFARVQLTPIIKRHWSRLNACRPKEKKERPATRRIARVG